MEAKRLVDQLPDGKVDFIIGHNQFGYQFQEHLRAKISHLREEDWDSMINYNAFFGHVHKRSHYGKIQVAGSFDRLAHGEEAPKGFLDVTYFETGEREVRFIENTQAELYQTIELLHEYDIANKQHIQWLYDRINGLKADVGFVRIRYFSDEIPIKDVIHLLKQYAPQYVYTGQLQDNTPNTTDTIELPDDEIAEIISITPDNVIRLIQDIIPPNMNESDIVSLVKHYLEEM